MSARLFVLSALLGAACSSAPPPAVGQKPVFPVTGQVFVNDKPAVGAFVLLVPVSEAAGATDPRPRAEVREDGSFALSTYGGDDGAAAGEYLVGIRWPDGNDIEDRLKGRYADPVRSKLKATVQAGPTTLPPFKLK